MRKLNLDAIKAGAQPKTNKKEKDPRFLNYYEMQDGDTMTIRFVPVTEEELFVTYKTHGPKLKNRDIRAIRCPKESLNEKCAVCEMTYENWKEAETKDEKDEVKRWFPKETTLGACVVIKSNIEINYPEDGNPVKLMHVPTGIREKVNAAVLNGQVDDPCDRDFVIVIKKNTGEYASYDNSFFKGVDSPLDPELMKMFETGEAYYPDASEHYPTVASSAESAEWLQDALAKESGDTGQSPPPAATRTEEPAAGGEPEEKTSTFVRPGAAKREEQPTTGAVSSSALKDRLRRRAG